jgi:hypothetical protein
MTALKWISEKCPNRRALMAGRECCALGVWGECPPAKNQLLFERSYGPGKRFRIRPACKSASGYFPKGYAAPVRSRYALPFSISAYQVWMAPEQPTHGGGDGARLRLHRNHRDSQVSKLEDGIDYLSHIATHREGFYTRSLSTAFTKFQAVSLWNTCELRRIG